MKDMYKIVNPLVEEVNGLKNRIYCPEGSNIDREYKKISFAFF